MPSAKPASTASTTSSRSKPGLDVQLGGEPHLGVDDAVGGEVLDALPGHPVQRVGRLHHRDGVREALEVADQVPLRASRRRTSCAERGRVGRPAARGSRSRRPARRSSPAAARRRGGRAAGPWGRRRSGVGSSVGSGMRHGYRAEAMRLSRRRSADPVEHQRAGRRARSPTISIGALEALPARGRSASRRRCAARAGRRRRTTSSPGLRQADARPPRRRRRPPCGPGRRRAARPRRRRPARRAGSRTPPRSATTVSTCAAVGSAAPGRRPGRRSSARQTAIAEPSASAAAGSASIAGALPASRGPARAVTSRRSSGRRRRAPRPTR